MPTIAVLYQNDDFGKDYLKGMRAGLGDKADKMVVATQSYETTDPTVDSQIVALQGSGANVLLTAAIPKFTTLAIRKVYDIGWRPTQFINSVSTSVGSVMKPAGLEKGVGIISAAYTKDPTDPQWQNTPEFAEWLAWMKKYNTSGNVADAFTVYGYSTAQTLVAVLKACGDNLTRENVMKQAARIHDLKLPMLLPGITISTGADDYAPIKQMQLQKFDGNTWKVFGDVMTGSGSKRPARIRGAPRGGSDASRTARSTIGLSAAALVFTGVLAACRWTIRSRRQRHRDQDRQHDAV